MRLCAPNANVAEVWVFSPAKYQSQTRAFRSALQRLGRQRGWTVQERLTSFERPGGRPTFTIAPEDAFNLYRRMHEVKVGVLSLGESFVRIEPRATSGLGLALGQFVRYKAQWMGTIGLNPSQGGAPKVAAPNAASLDAFDRWPWPQPCDGSTDPRILPLSVFLGLVKAEDLDVRAGRVQFNGLYGSRTRIDPRQRTWRHGNHFHPPVRLASLTPCRVPDGFHWDVGAPKRAPREIANAIQVWRIAENGYVNVYPNSHIRGGKPHARRVWPK